MTPTAEINNNRCSTDITQCISRAREQVQAFLAEWGDERLRSLWQEWNKRFQKLLAESRKRPEVAISLVGGVGSGKSTLLNALIGARVLPVSNMRACTAAISEVAYAEGPYQAQVEFIS